MEDNREISYIKEQQLENLFNATIDLIYDTLGVGIAFRKPKNQQKPEDGFYKNLINGAIFESQMVSFSRAIDNNITQNLRQKTFSAFSDDNYWNSLFQGTSKKNKAIKRNTVLTQYLLG